MFYPFSFHAVRCCIVLRAVIHSYAVLYRAARIAVQSNANRKNELMSSKLYMSLSRVFSERSLEK